MSKLIILHEEGEDGNSMPNLEAPVVAVSKAVSNLVRSVRTADNYTFIFQQVTVKCKSYRDVMSRCGQTPHSWHSCVKTRIFEIFKFVYFHHFEWVLTPDDDLTMPIFCSGWAATPSTTPLTPRWNRRCPSRSPWSRRRRSHSPWLARVWSPIPTPRWKYDEFDIYFRHLWTPLHP